MSAFTIAEEPVPTDDSDPFFTAMVDLKNTCEIAGYGIPEVAVTVDDMLPQWRDPSVGTRAVLARDATGTVIGRVMNSFLLAEPHAAWVTLNVEPSARRQGVGSALLDRVESLARELGQTRLMCYAVSPDGPGERLPAPTGFGSVPADNAEVRFALAHGWTLEQVERGSRFPLPADAAALAALRADAEPHAADYEVVTWTGAAPTELLEDLAELQTRMSTDAPSAGLGQPEDVWTAERFAEHDALLLGGSTDLLNSAARHRDTGRLAGFTRLRIPRDPARAVGQWDTIVLRAHRGHRLGMLLKVANLQALDASFPGHPSVLTWNAEENRHMLDVNEAVGFVPIGYEGAWAKTLSP